MLTDPYCWTLLFDGTTFRLEPGSRQTGTSVRARVLEEGLETILFHWGNYLLPAPRLFMLSCSAAITREQDLLAVDELGRIHIFELKKDTADAKSVFQLVSYLVSRPANDQWWVSKGLANTLWYGESAAACRLAGLVAREPVEKLRTAKSRKVVGERVAQAELLDARLDKLSQLASDRTGLPMTLEMWRAIAGSLLKQEFGGAWQGPLNEPGKVFDVVAKAKLPAYWKLGKTDPRIVIWMVAPGLGTAVDAAQPFIDRGLEIRLISADVREVVPGREWSIAIAAPASHKQNWARADSFAPLLRAVADKHMEACPQAVDRVRLWLQPASTAWATDKGSSMLGWRAAGGAGVYFDVWEDHISHFLFNHNWTQGASLKKREPILRICKNLRKRHPSSWAWSPRERNADSNMDFVQGAAQLVNDYWQSLAEIGAFDIDQWGYWMPDD